MLKACSADRNDIMQSSILHAWVGVENYPSFIPLSKAWVEEEECIRGGSKNVA